MKKDFEKYNKNQEFVKLKFERSTGGQKNSGRAFEKMSPR